MARYSQAEILEQLDQAAREFEFPMLDNGFTYPVDVRLHAYRDDVHWSFIIEVVGYQYRAPGHDGISNTLYCFGNCLIRKPGCAAFLCHSSDGPEGECFDDDCFLRPEVSFMQIRAQPVPLQHDPAYYADLGIELGSSQVEIFELLRGLSDEHRKLLFATEDELRAQLTVDLPEILSLESWHHPDLANDELPSASITFQSLAETLVSGDVSRYQAQQPPNTHWRNWPEGGTL